MENFKLISKLLRPHEKVTGIRFVIIKITNFLFLHKNKAH